MTVDSILRNDHGVTAIACMPAVADVVSGSVPAPTPAPSAVEDWCAWFKRSPAGGALSELLDTLGVEDVIAGHFIWRADGYLPPGASPWCGPCQFEFQHLVNAGADGGCIALVCSAPGKPGFCIHVGANLDGTRMLLWPENISLGKRNSDVPPDRHGW